MTKGWWLPWFLVCLFTLSVRQELWSVLSMWNEFFKEFSLFGVVKWTHNYGTVEEAVSHEVMGSRRTVRFNLGEQRRGRWLGPLGWVRLEVGLRVSRSCLGRGGTCPSPRNSRWAVNELWGDHVCLELRVDRNSQGDWKRGKVGYSMEYMK